MKPLNVNEEMMQQILSGPDWAMAGVEVVTEETVSEGDERLDERESKNAAKGDTDNASVDEGEGGDVDALELLHALLDELNDDELLEHAASMLEVFDAAAEELNLLSEEDEEIQEETDSEVDDIDNMSPALMRAVLRSQRNEGLL
jgi:hypothetical protein